MKRLVVLVLLLLSSVVRAQAPEQMQQAKKEFDTGQTAYDLAHYDQALTHFTRAYELSKLPGILYNLGQAYRRLYETAGGLDNLRKAREMYRSYLRLVPMASERSFAEERLKEIEVEYDKQLHAQRDKLVVEAKGIGALNLAEDFVAQDDLEAGGAALERFVKAPSNLRPDVARGLRVRARIEAAMRINGAVDDFARALELDPATAPPPDREKLAVGAFRQAQSRMKGKPPLALQHVPPNRLKIGAAPRLRVDVANDTLGMVSSLVVHYRAGASAYATETVKPGEFGFPPTFAASLAPGTRVEYWVGAVDGDGAVLDVLGSEKVPFALHVDEKPAKPLAKRWQFWVGLAAGVVVAGGVAAAVGVTQAPPDRVPIPVQTGLLSR